MVVKSGPVIPSLFLALSLLFLVPTAVSAQNDFANADMDNGEEINEVCAGCHGEFGEGGKEGEYPRLAGQPAAFIARQLELFRDRHRPNMAMIEYVDDRQMPPEDVRDISVFLERIKLLPKLPPLKEGSEFDAYERMLLTKRFLNIARVEGDHERGSKLYNRECKSCHGKDGVGKESQGVPMLAGQYTNYLWRQVDKYLKKIRIHDPEAPDEKFLELFSKEDLHDIFAFLSVVDDE